MKSAIFLVVLFGGALLSGCGSSSPVNGIPGGGNGGSGPPATIKVLSNRADLISGGDALVEVVPPAGTQASALSVSLNGRDVSGEFALRANGRYMGLVTGLPVGSSTLTARAPGAANANTAIINHPNGGPIFSGPQVQPWTCQVGAVDAQCNQPPVYTWLYKSTNLLLTELQPYDPTKPPSDVATTTTDQGVTVPFIVRVETGYQDRDQYVIATLYQASQPWTPWQAQKQWNHKLVITHGSSCGVSYEAESAPSIQNDGGGGPVINIPPLTGLVTLGDSPIIALGRGFAVMSTALDHNGQNCNIATQAESLMMAKEHLIETYGELRYTIGVGCSGGSLAQQQIANAYPGIHQGITPQCSFPDTWTSATQVADFHLLNSYFLNPSKWGAGILWTPLQWDAVEGNLLPLDSIISDIGFFGAVVPTTPCPGTDIAGHPETQLYNASTNPGGVRCGLPDFMINVLGPRPESEWSANEKALGHGFGSLPVDNVGVQYGLASLQQGVITPAMFLDLNAKIGGFDVDINEVPQRLAADGGALTAVYRSGAINEANNLKDVAIIDLRGPDPGIAHDAYRSWAVRARLQRAQGNFKNDVIWFGAVPVFGDQTYTTQALIAMDRWLAAVEPDTRAVPLAQKIVDDRPSDIQDRCTQVSDLTGPNGFFIPIAGVLLDPILGPILDPLLNVLDPVLDPAFGLVVDPVLNQVCGIGLVQTLVEMRFQTPRMVAGDDITTDANKCQLKPLSRTDNYGYVPFTDAQWAQMQTLFPSGVCDYNLPGVNQQPTIPWQTYQDSGGNVIYGGQALPSAPANSGGGWASPAFEEFSSGL